MKLKSKEYLNLLQVLLETKVHLGHDRSTWNSKLATYILSEYKNFHVLDLEQTIPLLKKALNVISALYKKGKNILIIGNSDVNKAYTLELIKNKNVFGVSTKWTGGSLTNFHKRHFKYTRVDNEKRPSLVILLNIKGNEIAIKEALQSKIPVIGIVDTDIDPKGIQYIIPGNDDSPQSQYLYYKLISNAIH
jgi:small subunit ribosomal protein S2